MRTGKLELLGGMVLDTWLALLLMAGELHAARIAERLGTQWSCPPERGICGSTLQAGLDAVSWVSMCCCCCCMLGTGRWCVLTLGLGRAVIMVMVVMVTLSSVP